MPITNVRLLEMLNLALSYLIRAAYVVLFSSIVVGGQLCANTIYTNLGAGDTWNELGGYVGGEFGTTFTATASGILTSVLIPIATNTNLVESDPIRLYQDSSGQPGILLENWVALVPPCCSNILTDLGSLANPTLTAGTQYWLVIQGWTQGIIWDWNNQGVGGGVWVSDVGPDEMRQIVASDPAPAIQLNGTAVPEPNGTVLCGILFFIFLKFQLRRGTNGNALIMR